MKHWHVVSSNGEGITYGVLSYDNCAKSVSDYVDIVYSMFPKMVSEKDRSAHMLKMLDFAETESDFCIYTASELTTIYWNDCIDDPCTFAIYN